MLDTMTFTKAGGALCGALLVFLLAKWAAEELYDTSGGKGFTAAFEVEVAGADTAEAVVEDVDYDALFAAADAGAGERHWRQCSACHALEDGRQGTGPSLYGILGREKGAIDGFRYSGAMTSAGGTWEFENLYEFIANPRGYLPGTSMAYGGMRRSEDRADLIAYIVSHGN